MILSARILAIDRMMMYATRKRWLWAGREGKGREGKGREGISGIGLDLGKETYKFDYRGYRCKRPSKDVSN